MSSALPRLEIRTIAVREDGCFSAWLWDKLPFAVSVEHTFADRRIVLSNGIFLAKRDFYFKGDYPTFEIQVDGHDRVLIHRGAIEDHSLACVIPGKSFGGYDPLTKTYSEKALGAFTQVAVLQSSVAFDEFMQRADGLQEFHIWVNGR